MKTPSKCRTCGSSDLIWFTLRNTRGAQGEPLRMPEIAYDFILGCKECSETLRVLRAEDVAEYLTLLRTLPAQQGAEEHEAVEVVGYLNESGTYYPSMDSVERYAPPGDWLRRLMTVAQHERILDAWQRSQSARVPEGLSLDLRDIHGALAAAHSAFVYRGQSTSCEYALTRVAEALHEVANALHAGDREDE